ncbi:hypothetical protein C8Q79DRAFT_1005387 [Trametes meyenii]|nr:hypothetical protein C8Q79DRAFT_1005387 [Trametes meyenii]
MPSAARLHARTANPGVTNVKTTTARDKVLTATVVDIPWWLPSDPESHSPISLPDPEPLAPSTPLPFSVPKGPDREDSSGDFYEANGPRKPDENFYNALFKTLEATKSSKWSINNPSSPAGQLSKLARLIPRQWGPFLNMGTVVTVGMSWYDGPPARWADKDKAT